MFLFTGCSTKGEPGFGGEGDAPTSASTDTAQATTPAARPNILLIIADDVGIDQSGLYQDVTGLDDRDYASTPTLDEVCQRGVRFEQAWAQPTCLPTRGNLITGRYGFRTGLLSAGNSQTISPDEVTLPTVLSEEAGYRTASVGKWHLGTEEELGGVEAPNTMGWGHYSGNLQGEITDYWRWRRTTDGVQTEDTRYATTAQVDDALAWLRENQQDQQDQQDQGEPWLLWMGFNSPHIPIHLPPAALHDNPELDDDPDTISQDPAPYFRAMLESLDAEVGRLLSELEATGELEDTVILYLGDNGTDSKVSQPESLRSGPKGTLNQGGVWVPMCAAGPGLPGGVSSGALVHAVDLFATALELGGVDISALPAEVGRDSRSLGPLLRDPSAAHRDHLYAETDLQRGRVGGVTVRGERYKLIVEDDGAEFLYDLSEDLWEERDLIDQRTDDAALQAAYDELKGVIEALHGG